MPAMPRLPEMPRMPGAGPQGGGAELAGIRAELVRANDKLQALQGVWGIR